LQHILLLQQQHFSALAQWGRGRQPACPLHWSAVVDTQGGRAGQGNLRISPLLLWT